MESRFVFLRSANTYINLDYLVALTGPDKRVSQDDPLSCKLELRDSPNRVLWVTVQEYALVLRVLENQIVGDCPGTSLKVFKDEEGNIYDEQGSPLPF